MRKVILLFSAIYFIGLVILGFLIYRASPGPSSQEILGVGISDSPHSAAIVYISGRRLQCTPAENNLALASVCAINLEGKLLEIRAQRNAPTHPNQLGGACEAFYDNKEWPCSIASRHVDVSWFAYINLSPGLSQTQLDALRREYFFENLPEQVYIAGMIVIPVLTMVVAVAVMTIWLRPRARRRAFFAGAVAAVGIISLTGTFILSVLLTRGFWD